MNKISKKRGFLKTLSLTSNYYYYYFIWFKCICFILVSFLLGKCIKRLMNVNGSFLAFIYGVIFILFCSLVLFIIFKLINFILEIFYDIVFVKRWQYLPMSIEEMKKMNLTTFEEYLKYLNSQFCVYNKIINERYYSDGNKKILLEIVKNLFILNEIILNECLIEEVCVNMYYQSETDIEYSLTKINALINRK